MYKKSFIKKPKVTSTGTYEKVSGVRPSEKKISTSPVLKERYKKPLSTSWGAVADWYDSHLATSNDTYHAHVIFPNVLRILGEVKGKKVLDLACGQGIFTEQLADLKADVTGVDIGKELIAIAEKNSLAKKKKGVTIQYHVASANDLYMIKSDTCDVVVCILALQNIENLEKTTEELSRVLKKGGRSIIVLNHPMFRNPRKTQWGYDEENGTQYRRVDEYMSESHVKIDMTPGNKTDKKYTISFHRPLQMYMKTFLKQGLSLVRLEEWISHRESKSGPKQKAENTARKEIPLFMCLEMVKVS